MEAPEAPKTESAFREGCANESVQKHKILFLRGTIFLIAKTPAAYLAVQENGAGQAGSCTMLLD